MITCASGERAKSCFRDSVSFNIIVFFINLHTPSPPKGGTPPILRGEFGYILPTEMLLDYKVDFRLGDLEEDSYYALPLS